MFIIMNTNAGKVVGNVEPLITVEEYIGTANKEISVEVPQKLKQNIELPYAPELQLLVIELKE